MSQLPSLAARLRRVGTLLHAGLCYLLAGNLCQLRRAESITAGKGETATAEKELLSSLVAMETTFTHKTPCCPPSGILERLTRLIDRFGNTQNPTRTHTHLVQPFKMIKLVAHLFLHPNAFVFSEKLSSRPADQSGRTSLQCMAHEHGPATL